MTKNEGEYELVLGNRQLLSAFFIIVILFGVFFTMGYVVGRNSAPAVAASSPPAPAASGQKQEAPPAQSAAPPTQSSTRPPAQETKEPAVETKPVALPEKKATPPERPSAPARENPAATDASGAVTVNPGAGNMYLQVAAAAQPQAGVVVDTLKKKGFPAMLAKGPNATLYRVVVGPYADSATLGKAKADLENAGFHPLVRK